MGSRPGNTSRVRIFVDYWNFANSWEKKTGALPDKNLDWAAFPAAVIDALDERIPQLRRKRKELRGIKVYVSSRPSEVPYPNGWNEENKLQEDRRLQNWLQNDLDQLTAYTVDITQLADSPLHCKECGSHNSRLIEQGVDTKIAIDLVALASSDLYDIAVLVTDDSDLVPSTQCVQDSIDKQVVHLGIKGEGKVDRGREVRNEAWGHLFIEHMLSDILKD